MKNQAYEEPGKYQLTSNKNNQQMSMLRGHIFELSDKVFKAAIITLLPRGKAEHLKQMGR